MESVFSGPGSRRGEDNYSMMDSVGKKVPLAPTGSLNKGSIQSNHHSNHAAAPMAPAQAEEHPGLAPGSSANTSVANALKGVEFIAQHIKDEDRDNEVGKTHKKSLLKIVKLSVVRDYCNFPHKYF